MDWAAGYPIETKYKVGFYRNLAPSHLAMICALQGVTPPAGPLTYLELGCGAGLSTLLLAATNPDDSFIGIDFAPSHIVEANKLARDAEIHNVKFIEASFDDEDLVEALPPCDIVSLHGVYTWVGPRQRVAIRNILLQRLKTGGIFYIAYNNMVASSFEIVLQRALRELSRTGTPAGLKAAFEKIKQMKLLGAEHFKHNPALTRLIEEIDNKDPTYLVHEYLTDHWTPYFFQDLAREMEGCKLSFVGSASPADNREDFTASPDMMSLINDEHDPNVRQFLTDISTNRRFRNDIFVRGVNRFEPQQGIDLLRRTAFAVSKPRSDIELKVTIGRGVLELRRPIFRTILDYLSDGPKTLGGMTVDDNALIEAVTLLSQAAIIHPANSDEIDATAGHRLNKIMFSTEHRRTKYEFAAAPQIGSAIPVSAADRIFLATMQDVSLPAAGKLIPSQAEQAPPGDRIAFWKSLQIIEQ